MTMTESAPTSTGPDHPRSHVTFWLSTALVVALAAVAALSVALARGSSTASSTPTLREAMTYALDAGKPAALAPFFATSVDYAIAASGGFGTVSGSEAARLVADYVDNAHGPWDFSLSADTVEKFRNGPYQRYLYDDDFFGVSSDGRFVSVRTNDRGEIDQVFLAVNTHFVE